VIGRNGADLGNHFAGNRLAESIELAFFLVAFFVEFAGDDLNGLLDAALHGHRIRASSNGFHAFAINRLR